MSMSLAALLKQDSSFIPSRCKRDAVSAPSQPQENQRFCVGRDDRTGDSSRNVSPAPPALFILPSERQKVTSAVASPCCEVRGYIRKLVITRHSSQADSAGPSIGAA